MTREDALRIIDEEELVYFKFFEDRNNRPDEVVIEEKEGKYYTYVTSERAGIMEETILKFSNESDALEDFLARLRDDKILRELMFGGKY